MKKPFEVVNSFKSHDATLHGVFQSRLCVKGDQDFLVQGDLCLSWKEFGAQYEQLAAVLMQHGVMHGMRVAVISKNDCTHVLALFALARIGAIMVPVNPEFGVREMSYVLKHADVCGVLIETAVIDTVTEVLNDFAQQPWILIRDVQLDHPQSLAAAMNSAQAYEPDQTVKSTDTCIIIYTSGTTGFPKGVMHSQFNLVSAGEANIARLHLQPSDRVMIILPFFHVNAIFYSLSGAVAAGACVILAPRFSATSFWNIAADTRATVVNIIEAIGTILCARDRSEFRADHQLRVAYGVRKLAAPVFRNDFKIDKLFSGFGMTEIPGVTCNPYDGENIAGSMGMIGQHPDPSRSWAECRIVDEQGNDVPVGEVGEFWVKHPIAMQGYFRDPEQTAQAFHGDWFKTGDLVKKDHNDYYFYVSRKKDIIRRRGENISAAELEMVMAEQPSVFECAAVAVPSPLGEDDILVALSLRPGTKLEASEVVLWCKERLSAVKVPRYVAILKELPHTPTHKIAKAILRSDPTVLAGATDFQVNKNS